MAKKKSAKALALSSLVLLIILYYSFQQRPQMALEDASSTFETLPTVDSSSEASSDIRGPSAAQQQPKSEQHQKGRTISLIVRLRGEMANLLSQLVFAKGIQWWVEDHSNTSEFNGLLASLELIGERQSGSKWKRGVEPLQKCFPNLREMRFEGGRWDEDFQIRKEQQREWVGDENHRAKLLIDRGDSNCDIRTNNTSTPNNDHQEWFCLHDQLAYLQHLLVQQQQQQQIVGSNKDDSNSRYSLPFLVTSRLASFDVLVDQYFERIREWLIFDYGSCCSSFQPYPDEVVVHIRNFRAEMRERNYLERGYEELSPQRMAQELLGHLPVGSKVAIASRGEAYVDLYVKALRQRGLQVRTTPSDHSGVQDFCFLLQAEREIVGTMRSTYTRWAAILGKAQRAQLYSMDSPSIRKAQGNDDFTKDIHYQWKRPELKAKVSYHVFMSNGTL